MVSFQPVSSILTTTGSSISPIVDGNKLRNSDGHPRFLQPLTYWMVPANSAGPHEVHGCPASRSWRGDSSCTSAVQTTEIKTKKGKCWGGHRITILIYFDTSNNTIGKIQKEVLVDSRLAFHRPFQQLLVK